MIQSIFHEAKSKGPLYALFLNCTLNKSPYVSNTEALCNLLVERLKAHEPDIETKIIRVADYNVLPGIANDEGEGDEWPEILEEIKRCNIFIPAMAIWMGVRSSIAQRVIERLDGTTKTVMCERTGQFPLYGSVCGCVVTGNEDGTHPHQEINANSNEPLQCVLVRNDQEPVVVNLEIEAVEEPEEVVWVDPHHPVD